MNKAKKWSLAILIAYGFIMIFIGVTVVITDPYFHFHGPIRRLSYEMNKPQYMNDGMAKNFDYEAIITGTSTSQGFSEAEAVQLFGKKFIRITYMGEGFRRINETINTGIAHNPKLDTVIWGVDREWFVTDEDWLGYDEYPNYLYDSSIWNDTNYLFNKEIWSESIWPEIINSLKGVPSVTMDEQTYFYDNTGREKVLEDYERPEREEKALEEAETEEFFYLLEHNLNKNVLTTIKNNPDIEFILFIPPYSICWWDNLHQYGDDVVKRRISLEQYAIEQFLQYDNVRVFSFSNNYEMVCNLDYYADQVHYGSKASSMILNWIHDGKYELTEDNYMDYINDITEFYCNFNYDGLLEMKAREKLNIKRI